MCICIDGRMRHLFPIPAAYIADIKEANEVFGIRPYPGAFPDINTLVHKDDLNDIDICPLPRLESSMYQVWIMNPGLKDCRRFKPQQPLCDMRHAADYMHACTQSIWSRCIPCRS